MESWSVKTAHLSTTLLPGLEKNAGPLGWKWWFCRFRSQGFFFQDSTIFYYIPLYSTIFYYILLFAPILCCFLRFLHQISDVQQSMPCNCLELLLKARGCVGGQQPGAATVLRHMEPKWSLLTSLFSTWCAYQTHAATNRLFLEGFGHLNISK